MCGGDHSNQRLRLDVPAISNLILFGGNRVGSFGSLDLLTSTSKWRERPAGSLDAHGNHEQYPTPNT